MNTRDYLSMLRNEMHSVVIATTDQENHPVTRVIDIMLSDDTTFYFLTAQSCIVSSGMCGGEGMDLSIASIHKKAISVHGAIECIGTDKLVYGFHLSSQQRSTDRIPHEKRAWRIL